MRRKRKNNSKKIIIVSIFFIFVWVFGFYLYTTYQNIEIDQNNYTAERQQSTIEEQTVENAKEKSTKIADMIEETTQKVVGISKLKNTGSSIFTDSEESELGLGTGFIVTQDGYIVSNTHVTGEKYG